MCSRGPRPARMESSGALGSLRVAGSVVDLTADDEEGARPARHEPRRLVPDEDVAAARAEWAAAAPARNNAHPVAVQAAPASPAPHACGGGSSPGAAAPGEAAVAPVAAGKQPRDDASDGEDHDQCIICHEEFDNSGHHRVVALACGHLFGQNCITKWLGERKTCPSCNKKAKRADIRPIFFTKVVVRDTAELEAIRKEAAREKAQRLRAEDELKRRQQDLVRAQVAMKSLEAQMKRLRQRVPAPLPLVPDGASRGRCGQLAHGCTGSLGSKSEAPWGGGAADGAARGACRQPLHPLPCGTNHAGPGAGASSAAREGGAGGGWESWGGEKDGAGAAGASLGGRCAGGARGKEGVELAEGGKGKRWRVTRQWRVREGKVVACAEGEGCFLVSCAVGGCEGGGRGSGAGRGLAWTLCKLNYLSGLRENLTPPLHAKPITDCKVYLSICPSMYMCAVYTCIHTYIYACMHTYIHTYIHSYKHTYIHKHIRTYRRTYK